MSERDGQERGERRGERGGIREGAGEGGRGRREKGAVVVGEG